MSDIENLVERIRSKHLDKEPKKESKTAEVTGKIARPLTKIKDSIGDFFHRHKKTVAATAGAVALASVISYWFAKDYLTKRLAYPIRNVTYHCQETVSFSGGDDLTSRTDKRSVSIITKGNEDGTKLGDLLGIFKREYSDETEQYQLEDENKTRIAYANKKKERVQGGMSLNGAIDFRERFAELIGKPGKFITYSFVPERGYRNIQLNVLQDENKKRTIVNELVTHRAFVLGWLWGPDYRAGTELNEFADTAENKKKLEQLLALIDTHDTTDLSKQDRVKIVKQMVELEQSLEKVPIYASIEDGIVDMLPQESTTYLFHNPSLTTPSTRSTTAKSPLLPPFALKDPNGQSVSIRVENFWDLWPGNYPVLNKITLGNHPNIIKPFARVNNGGYILRDSKGDIAKIVIEDFILHYGDDLVYRYYLDKDGNGRLTDNELISRVLCRVSHDQKELAEGDNKDRTQRFMYTFMAGTDWEKRREEFYLCNTIESFIVNELNRGFGKHSVIGWINNQRSNILLLEDRTLRNMGRALTPESAMVAKYDIVALLKAAKRDYIDQFVSEK